MDKIFVKKNKRYEEFAKNYVKDSFETTSNSNKLSELKDYAIEKDDIKY